jgi:hypothetical protein
MLGLFLVWGASAQAATVYVDKDATGPTHDGSSWCNAYLTVQDALVAATAGTTIRVANGTYTPDQGGGQTPGDRSATFQLKNGVNLEGGYTGCGAADPDARDIALYETILSGDLNGDDTAMPCTQGAPDCDSFGELCADGFCIIGDNNDENSYHVVTGSTTNVTATFGGFIVTAGNANAASPDDGGAGIYNVGGSPTVNQATFRGNFAGDRGAGMYNVNGSSPTVSYCTFRGNSTSR